jgi:outer membrane protein TolC
MPDGLHLSYMRRILRALAVSVMATAVSPAAAGQEPLTLEVAVRETLTHNARLAAARAASDEASAAADAARAAFFPRISFSESWQRSNDPVFVFGTLLSARRFTAGDFAIDALNQPPATAAFRTTIDAQQVVFDGGRTAAAAHAARRQADAAHLLADGTAADLTVAATEAFGRILASQAAARSADAALAAGREDQTRAERRRDAGLATDADVLAFAVHIADLERRAIEARGDAAVAMAELNRLMGRPIESTFAVAVPLADDATLGSLDELLAQADAARPEIRRARALVDAAHAAQQGAASALLPQIAVQAGVDFAGTAFEHRAGAWIAGGQLRWSFSTRGGELAGRRAAAGAAVRAEAESSDAKAAVHVEVVTALRRLEAARASRAAGRAAVARAREAERIVRDRFEAGMASVNDVLRASSDRLDAETHETSALVDAIAGAAALARAVGRTP